MRHVQALVFAFLGLVIFTANLVDPATVYADAKGRCEIWCSPGGDPSICPTQDCFFDGPGTCGPCPEEGNCEAVRTRLDPDGNDYFESGGCFYTIIKNSGAYDCRCKTDSTCEESCY